MADVKPIPDGYPQVTPYLHVDGAAEAIEFYSKVLGAKERMRMPGPDGKLGHAELELGESVIMLADEHAELGALSPKSVGGSPVTVHVYVDDVDAVFQAAVAAGATAAREVEDQFYGDRSGQFVDPFGHHWSIATHVEDVPPEEMERRAATAMSG
jgi:PhnB protein